MSGRSSIIEIDADTEIRKIIGQLDGLRNQIGAPKLLKNALNSTARKVRKQFVKDAQGRYAVKDKSIFKKEDQGAPKLYTASPTNLTATIVSKGPMQDIMSFLTRPNMGTGAAAAQVLNSGSLKPLELEGLKAFVTRFASGHVAIVQRRGPERLPVKKLLSPSVPHMLGNEEVREQAEEMTYEILQSEIDRQIQRVFARAA